jgi:hypothetical protein
VRSTKQINTEHKHISTAWLLAEVAEERRRERRGGGGGKGRGERKEKKEERNSAKTPGRGGPSDQKIFGLR